MIKDIKPLILNKTLVSKENFGEMFSDCEIETYELTKEKFKVFLENLIETSVDENTLDFSWELVKHILFAITLKEDDGIIFNMTRIFPTMFVDEDNTKINICVNKSSGENSAKPF